MVNDFLYALWFFLPAGAANMAPVLVAHLPLLRHWNAPLDGGKYYRGKRLLGSSKTWRGLVCGIIFAAFVALLQQKLSHHLGGFSMYLQQAGYADVSFLLGVLLGAGALIGDAIESFFKRQRAVAPGASWFPFDQLDYIIGGCLLAMLVSRLPLKIYGLVVIAWFIIHLASSYVGYLLHLKKTPI